MTMKTQLLLMLIPGCINILTAQNDFVVTNKNDTIHGTVSITRAGEVKIKYRNESGKRDRDTFSASSIRAYSQDGLFYESHPITPLNKNASIERVLVMKIESGTLSLYKETNYGYATTGTGGLMPISETKYYFKKTNETFMTRARASQKKLMTYFNDCEEVRNALNNKTIKKKDFRSFVKLYNEYCGK
jgi:hypothetical protein